MAVDQNQPISLRTPGLVVSEYRYWKEQLLTAIHLFGTISSFFCLVSKEGNAWPPSQRYRSCYVATWWKKKILCFKTSKVNLRLLASCSSYEEWRKVESDVYRIYKGDHCNHRYQATLILPLNGVLFRNDQAGEKQARNGDKTGTMRET